MDRLILIIVAECVLLVSMAGFIPHLLGWWSQLDGLIGFLVFNLMVFIITALAMSIKDALGIWGLDEDD